MGADIFVAVYFNALTGKVSYALIHRDQRVTRLFLQSIPCPKIASR